MYVISLKHFDNVFATGGYNNVEVFDNKFLNDIYIFRDIQNAISNSSRARVAQ